MLACMHASHVGGDACYRQACETLYWPNMQAEIKDFVSTCTACNEHVHNQQKETMLSHEVPIRPWQIVSMDLFSHGRKDYLLIVDHYSDFGRSNFSLNWLQRRSSGVVRHSSRVMDSLTGSIRTMVLSLLLSLLVLP